MREGGGRQSDAAFKIVYAAIQSCDLAPGSIVTEAQLSEQFGIPQAAMRAAADRLTVMRLLRPIRRKGYEVKPITLREVHEIFGLRAYLESAIMRAAAGRADVSLLRSLDVSRTESAEQRRANRAARTDENKAFHFAITRGLGNDRLTEVYAKVMEDMDRLINFAFSAGIYATDPEYRHASLIDALEAGDAGEAERIAVSHIRHYQDLVIGRLMTSPSLADVSIATQPAEAGDGERPGRRRAVR